MLSFLLYIFDIELKTIYVSTKSQPANARTIDVSRVLCVIAKTTTNNNKTNRL